MTRPRVLFPCEGFVVLAAVLRDPEWAATLEPLGVLDAVPAGPWRQVAYLATTYAGDLAWCGWGVLFGTDETVRICVRAQLRTHPAFRRVCVRDIRRVAIRCAAPVLQILISDGRAILEGLAYAAREAADRQSAEAAAFDTWLGGDRVA